jgi:hypothetical protein
MADSESRFEVLEEETHYPATHPKSTDKQAESAQEDPELKEEKTLEQQLERLVLSTKKDESVEGEDADPQDAQENVKKASGAKDLGNKYASDIYNFLEGQCLTLVLCRFFSRGSFLDAIECYTTALKLCPAEEEYANNRVRLKPYLLLKVVVN